MKSSLVLHSSSKLNVLFVQLSRAKKHFSLQSSRYKIINTYEDY